MNRPKVIDIAVVLTIMLALWFVWILFDTMRDRHIANVEFQKRQAMLDSFIGGVSEYMHDIDEGAATMDAFNDSVKGPGPNSQRGEHGKEQ